METAWRFRIMLLMAIYVILFGDFLGQNANGDEASKHDESSIEESPLSKHNAKSEKLSEKQKREKINQKKIYISKALQSPEYVNEDPSAGGDNKLSIKFFTKAISESKKKDEREVKEKISETLREACLPKLLCEIAAKPSYLLSDKEKLVLSLLKSTTLSIVAETPSRWHFSAHMGQLMAGNGQNGCSNLWPNCPYNSEKLMKLSGKVRLK